jgi:hypothetical protein
MQTPEGWEPPKVELTADRQKVYRPDGPVLRQFLRSTAYVSIIRGPIGSGTSSASCMWMFARACRQAPGPDGVRRTRWLVIRNTYADLKNTTIKTWLSWFPEEVYGVFKYSRPFQHVVRVSDVEMEVLFIALDDEADVAKLRSMELTGFWVNEGEFVERSIFDEALSRCGRFPPMRDGGPSWYGGIMDMNAPNEDHWVPMVFGEVPLPDDMPEHERDAFRRPASFEYFVQPPGLVEKWSADGKTVLGYEENPAAENTKWLPPGYYLKLIEGKSRAWVDSRVMNRISLYVEGSPVLPAFRPDVHVAREPLKLVPGHPLIVALDFGRRPAALFMQRIGLRWIIIHEMGMIDVSASVFAPAVKAAISSRWPDLDLATDVQFWGDPKGQDKVQSDEQTAYDVFRSYGMKVRPAPVPTNAISTRLEVWDHALTRTYDGYPGLLVSPTCRATKVALAGGYHWKKTGDGRQEPEKNRSSDYIDAGGYGLLGGGEGRAVRGVGHETRSKPQNLRPARRTLRRGAA